jgi:hypothetical protein
MMESPSLEAQRYGRWRKGRKEEWKREEGDGRPTGEEYSRLVENELFTKWKL